MLIRNAEIAGGPPCDVRLVRDRIAEIGSDLPARPGERVRDAGGGALLPGLHDHHLHLFALAAAQASIRCGPPEVRDAAELARALAGAGGTREWLRAVGYHESVAGELDRVRLDALVPDRPLRVQHRSGALWMLNSAGVDRLELDRGADAAGVERDARGRATGRLFRLDAWLRERLGSVEAPALGPVGRRLASFGVTGVTDATPGNSAPELCAFAAAIDRGELPQRLLLMGTQELPRPDQPLLERGSVKLVLFENELPAFDELVGVIAGAHRGGRSVAIHCVTRSELVLATTALFAAGSVLGDRIEHASVCPPDVLERLAELQLVVVTQPNFIAERGDVYRSDVEPRDRPWLYRCRAFLDAGVPLGAGTDAPFGDPDPWCAMRAAVDRRTRDGTTLGPDERLSPEQALALFTSPAQAPGAAPRAVATGAPADLCLLERPWRDARDELSSSLVAATIRSGTVVWER